MQQDLHCHSAYPGTTIIRILPVLDIRDGHAVHARGGRRDVYRGVRSVLYQGDDPIALALAIREGLDLSEFYVADLDAIGGGPPDLALLRRAARSGLQLWVDLGLRDSKPVDALLSAGARSVIAATETLDGPDALTIILRQSPAGSVVFGLDLDDGRLIQAPGATWNTDDPLALCDLALSIGIERILLLDRARIGTGMGVGTLPLVAKLLRRATGIEITVGGGIASVGDLRALAETGVSAALVGSAFHDGRIGIVELDQLRNGSPGPLVDG